MVDEHYYAAPTWMINNQRLLINMIVTKPKVYLGEYATRGGIPAVQCHCPSLHFIVQPRGKCRHCFHDLVCSFIGKRRFYAVESGFDFTSIT